MKNITILGSTGSIGTQALEVARAYGDRLNIKALTAGSNVKLLEAQIREFRPELAVLSKQEDCEILREHLGDEFKSLTIAHGMEGMVQAATLDGVDMVLTAIVGMIGIRPTIAAVSAGKDIALANKETLVCAGHIIMPLAREKNIHILPVDSEHSAIFQSLQGHGGEAAVPLPGVTVSPIRKILLTASGGPFRGYKREQFRDIKKEHALKHPNWSMGAKITIDSATMVNKALEVMEARWLFDVEPARIEIMVHPQSILHSAVMFEDGAVIGQMGLPDMKLPIQYAFLYPDRLPLDAPELSLAEIGSLTFEKPDQEVFRGLRAGMDAIIAGGSMPTVFNAANEEAVKLFLEDRISFDSIDNLIRKAMDQHQVKADPELEEILDIEKEIRSFVSGSC